MGKSRPGAWVARFSGGVCSLHELQTVSWPASGAQRGAWMGNRAGFGPRPDGPRPNLRPPGSWRSTRKSGRCVTYAPGPPGRGGGDARHGVADGPGERHSAKRFATEPRAPASAGPRAACAGHEGAGRRWSRRLHRHLHAYGLRSHRLARGRTASEMCVSCIEVRSLRRRSGYRGSCATHASGPAAGFRGWTPRRGQAIHVACRVRNCVRAPVVRRVGRGF